ncbi:MAG TPA: hypothetical protein VFX49_15790 [Chloroflexota bacterium]|nr:hypothetical protein [Chloroflexota bacterium]
MPPKKSRRLPGGKVRRPGSGSGGAAGGAATGGTRGAIRPARPADVDELDQSDLDDAPEGDGALDSAISLEEFRVARPVPETPPPPSRRLRERRGRAPVARTGPSPMELAALNYRHIRGDLLRIAIIAAVMFGIIIALSFVIK